MRGRADEGDEGVELQLEPWSKKDLCDSGWTYIRTDRQLKAFSMGCKKEIKIKVNISEHGL